MSEKVSDALRILYARLICSQRFIHNEGGILGLPEALYSTMGIWADASLSTA
jgi:hypothetical protein